MTFIPQRTLDDEPATRPHGAVGRFVAAGAVLVSCLIGLPIALVALARLQLGGAAPWGGFDPGPWIEFRLPLSGVPTDAAVVELAVRLAVGLGWLAFAALVLSFPAEVRHRRRHAGIGLPRSGPLVPVRAVVAWTVTGLTALTASPVVAIDVSDVLRVDAAEVASLTGAAIVLPGEGGVAGALQHAATGSTRKVAGTMHYTVRSGDSVLSIAERLLGGTAPPGSVHRLADAIVADNVGRTMPDGRVFHSPALIEPGWVLEVPVGPAASATVHTVEPGDTLWGLADAHLGDGRRWPELWEHNADRTMVDGSRFADPALIRVGWELEIVDGSRAADGEPLLVGPPDAVGRPEPVHGAGPAAVDASSDDRIERGADVAVNVDSEPTEFAPAVPVPPGDPAVDDVRHEVTEPVPERSAPVVPSVVDRPASVRPIATLGAMAAGAALALVAAQRRRRLRSAPVLGRIPHAPAVVEPIERELRLLGRDERPLRVDLATRCAAPSLDDAAVRILAVTATADGALGIVADGDVTLAEPWVGSGRDWTLPGDVSLDRLAALSDGASMPCPTLVEIGTDEQGAMVAVDLAAVGSLDVVGAVRAEVEEVLRAIATSLAMSAFARDATLVTVGLDGVAAPDGRLWALDAGADADAALARLGGGARTGGVDPVEDLAVVFDPAARRQIRVASTGPGVGRRLDDRSDEHPDGPRGELGHGADRIRGAVLRRGSTGWELTVERGLGRPWSVTLAPVGIDADQGRSLAELVAESDRAVGPEPEAVVDRADDATVATDVSTWQILVRVLGPVDIVDRQLRPIAFRRGKSRELVVWLTTHRDRATREGARTALWESDVRHATMSNVLSEARRALAVAVDPGSGHWIERTEGDRIDVHDAVVTDLDLVLDAVARARDLPAVEVVDTVGPLLALIRGTPFHGTGYAWTDAEGITSHAVVAATSAATVVAQAYLDLGDLDGVFEATATGLAVLPGHEALIGLRLRAHAARGDRAALREEWCAYERSLASDPWFDGEPAPSLLELRRELLVTTAA